MLSSLKPGKANVIGTVLLLVANYAGSFVSRLASGALIPRSGNIAQFGNGSATQFAGSAGRAAYAGGESASGGAGLLSSAISLVVLAVLFYVVVSFVVGAFANPQESREEKGTPRENSEEKGEAVKAARKDKSR